MMEIREIEAQKQLLAKIEESLEEKQRELNDRDAMFERAMEKQRMQFDEEKRELEKIGQEVAALLEQQKFRFDVLVFWSFSFEIIVVLFFSSSLKSLCIVLQSFSFPSLLSSLFGMKMIEIWR